MGVQTMGSHGNVQQSHLQQLGRQKSWFSLTLDEVGNQLGYLDKLGSMNIDELIKNVCPAEANPCDRVSGGCTSPASSFQLQASLALVRAFSGKTVDEVWRDIHQGQKITHIPDMNYQGPGDPALGETTLEDFLVKSGLFVADASLAPEMALDNELASQSFAPEVGMSPSLSIETLSDSAMPGRKRGSGEIEKTLDRRLRRKIKNRESAARSRARKQAYQNELVSKVSHLEEENMKLKKEKVHDLSFFVFLLAYYCFVFLLASPL
ncbi:OLC1v1001269C4 [Oldenlandia corymbosa var. corymbosa]|uniref:OLC1v1001269C4 n=1 Tax=Oldenlandia corymbosa var. corymbosa TaxID=529605 RepID=A0AAV1D4U6_OLDCO|nr:OLC1v1001269C4 [Oldenlandia corymbosa var. corymbosa]